MAIDWKQFRQQAEKTLSELTKKSKTAARNLNDSEFTAKARKTSFEAVNFARDKIGEGQRSASEHIRKRTEATSPSNWYRRAAEACETASDAVMRERAGVSS